MLLVNGEWQAVVRPALLPSADLAHVMIQQHSAAELGPSPPVQSLLPNTAHTTERSGSAGWEGASLQGKNQCMTSQNFGRKTSAGLVTFKSTSLVRLVISNLETSHFQFSD